jgi:hypothetical protein
MLADVVRGGAWLAAHETHLARADARRALRLANTSTPFTIAVRFGDGLDDRHRDAFAAAADRWVRIVVGELPGVFADGEYIDDVVVLARGVDLDGPGRVVGQVGPTHLRPAAAGRAAFLPAKGVMTFDVADLDRFAADGTLTDVLTHELGHVLGIGTVWRFKGLIGGETTYNPVFSGPGAMAEYQALRRGGRGHRVPVENAGGVAGILGGHWRGSVFHDELMTHLPVTPGAPLSRLTAASLGDLGYHVDLDAADPYELPELAPPVPANNGEEQARGRVLPVIPQVLPPTSLDT